MGLTDASVLLTGGIGFIGKHVLRLLVKAGVRVRVVDSIDERVHGTDALSTITAFRREFPDVPLVTKDYASLHAPELLDVTHVIHLAAQVSVADSMRDPMRYVIQNSLGTAKFASILRRAPRLRRVVVASSMSVYGEGHAGMSEDNPCVPASVYGLSKYDQERLFLMWGAQEHIPTCALRFFNVYGPGQSLTNGYTGVLANFANRLLHGESPEVYEDGMQTRDFIYVEDVAKAVVAVLDLQVAGPFNVCTGTGIQLGRAADLLADAINPSVRPVITGQIRPGDIRYCTGDPTRLIVATGWQARVPFDVGIARYAEALR